MSVQVPVEPPVDGVEPPEPPRAELPPDEVVPPEPPEPPRAVVPPADVVPPAEVVPPTDVVPPAEVVSPAEVVPPEADVPPVEVVPPEALTPPEAVVPPVAPPEPGVDSVRWFWGTQARIPMVTNSTMVDTAPNRIFAPEFDNGEVDQG